MLTVIIPNLNQGGALASLLTQLGQEDVSAIVSDIIVSDGGSKDDSLPIAIGAGARIVSGCCGRGHQLRRGVALVETDWLLFLHVDSQLSPGWHEHVLRHINTHPQKAGYFSMKFKANGFQPRFMEWAVGLRSFYLRLPYGDQGLLISRKLYDEIGGYQPMPLFEDLDIVRKLGRKRLTYIGCDLKTDASKYERDGFFKRGWRNIKLARRYYKGEAPEALLEEYNAKRL